MNDDAIPPACETARSPGPSQTSPPRRILVVEDDDDIRRLNTEVLIRHGYQVDTAEDGAVAWDALQLNRYDLIVTDNAMPKVTGVELLQKMHAAKMDLPVIMATGSFPNTESKHAPWVQPAAMVLKPYTIDDLLVAVMDVLRTVLPARQN